jgi:hypothetical protein
MNKVRRTSQTAGLSAFNFILHGHEVSNTCVGGWIEDSSLTR